jgi:hypothetical protein
MHFDKLLNLLLLKLWLALEGFLFIHYSNHF